MSLEDDTDNAEVELNELVTQTLEENGLLARIRAQLRAGLYLALESDINKRDQQSKIHGSLKAKLAKPDIRTIFCLVHEFLEYFELKFTLNVFERETKIGSIYSYENREKLIQDLDIGIDNNAPLLLEILNIARSSFNLSIRNESINKNDRNNDTYDVPSEKDSYITSITDSDVSQHVIDIKTVPKDNLIDPKSKLIQSNRDKIAPASSLSHLASNSNSDVSQLVTKDNLTDAKSKSNQDKNASNSNTDVIDIKTVTSIDSKSKSSLSHLASNSNSDVPNDLKSRLTKSPRDKIASESSLSHIASNSHSDVSQHVIDIKTVPKDNLIDSTKLSNDEIDSEPILSLINSNPNSDNVINLKSDEINDFKLKLSGNKVDSEPIFGSPKFLNLTKIAQLDEEQDDTYEGTSSIAEDSKDQSFLIDFDRSIKNATITSGLPSNLHAKTLLDQTIAESPKSPKISGYSTSTNLNPKTVIDQTNEESPKSPRLSFSPDSKKHDKSDRKPMSGLSSLADLPPLQLNKNRNTDTVLLPSLYSKDFREKNSLKEPDNYDDDFLSTSSAENESPRIKVDSNDEDKSAKSRSSGKSPKKKLNRDNKLDKENNDVSPRSTASSISEDLNSNIDDILKSTSS